MEIHPSDPSLCYSDMYRLFHENYNFFCFLLCAFEIFRLYDSRAAVVTRKLTNAIRSSVRLGLIHWRTSFPKHAKSSLDVEEFTLYIPTHTRILFRFFFRVYKFREINGQCIFWTQPTCRVLPLKDSWTSARLLFRPMTEFLRLLPCNSIPRRPYGLVILTIQGDRNGQWRYAARTVLSIIGHNCRHCKHRTAAVVYGDDWNSVRTKLKPFETNKCQYLRRTFKRPEMFY